MGYATEHIATALKNARAARRLSQRALSELTGVPQSHISRIESGSVDLRVSSLVELARVLDLELTLVPRKSVPAVNSIVRSTGSTPSRPGEHTAATRKQLKRLQVDLDELLQKYPVNTELAQLQRQIRDLQNFGFSVIDLGKLRDVNRAIVAFANDHDIEGLRDTLIEAQNLRNAAAHRAASAAPADIVRPAYTLEEDL